MSDSDKNNSNKVNGVTGGNPSGVPPHPPSATARGIVGVQLERLARTQRRRLVADIVAKIGVKRLEMAEDVVQDAVIAAMKTWPFKGMPDNPAAWLNRVARNKAYDRLRREGREQSTTGEDGTDIDFGLSDAEHMKGSTEDGHARFYGAQVTDPELKLIFLCCHDALSEEDRLMLTLKVVSGFTARDIAALFLKNEAAVGQRLARAKRKLRALENDAEGGDLSSLSRFAVQTRIPSVLKVIYLMFAVGYAPRKGDSLIMQDVAFEALRLAEMMADAPETTQPEAHALAALLSFQASRFGARVDALQSADKPSGMGEKLVLLRDQNRALWDRKLIDRGMHRLACAKAGGALSRYHLEAGIASLHATAPHFDATNWPAICGLYETLEKITGSPVVAVNACVAQAFNGAPEKAFIRLEALENGAGGNADLLSFAPFHIARAEILHMLGRPADAALSFKAALACGASVPVVAHLHNRLTSCD